VEPDVLPLELLVPDVPLVPLEPEAPLVPLVPEVPLVPLDPEAPLVPLDPEAPLVPDDPLVPVPPSWAGIVPGSAAGSVALVDDDVPPLPTAPAVPPYGPPSGGSDALAHPAMTAARPRMTELDTDRSRDARMVSSRKADDV
jgi:hypothetical protein